MTFYPFSIYNNVQSSPQIMIFPKVQSFPISMQGWLLPIKEGDIRNVSDNRISNPVSESVSWAGRDKVAGSVITSERPCGALW